MNHKKMLFCLCILLAAFILPEAKLNVVTSYPYQADIASRIGGKLINVKAMSKGNWDPHVIVPKPSLIARVRNADLLIINGAQLEIGWLPPVLKQANNPEVMPSKKGFLDLSNFVRLIQVPDSVSRAQGDIHPAGNPHFCLSPENIPKITQAICSKLIELDQQNEQIYLENKKNFLLRWNEKKVEWDKKMLPLKGKKYIEYHKNQDYFLEYYGLIVVDTIEPLPGIPPTSRHTLELIKEIKHDNIAAILHDTYHSAKCSKMVSKKTNTRFLIMPHDVFSIPEVKDIFSLFDEIVRRLNDE